MRLRQERCVSEAAQPEAVADHEHRRQGHRGAGDHRVQQPGHRQGQRGHVVAERPHQVALDRAQGAPREPHGVRRRTQVAADQRQVGRGHRRVGAGPERDAEVGPGQRRGVVDPVADHRDDPALLLQARHLVDLALREHAGHDRADADLVGDRPGHDLVVAGQQHRLEAEPLEPSHGLGGGRLHDVGDDQYAAGPPVPARQHRRPAGRPDLVEGGLELARHRHAPARQQLRPADHDVVPLHRPARPQAVVAGEVVDRRPARGHGPYRRAATGAATRRTPRRPGGVRRRRTHRGQGRRRRGSSRRW